MREVFDWDVRYIEVREWLTAEWRKPPADARVLAAAAVSGELSLGERGARHNLLKSERFRALLDELARAA